MKKYSTLLYTIGTISLFIIILYVFFNSSEEKKDSKRKPQKIDVDYYVVKPELLIDKITVSGSLMAYEEVQLKNEISGRIVKINLPEGKFVKEGTLLVKLYDDDLQTNLRKLQIQMESQERIFKRQEELLKVNGISQNEFDNTSLIVNSTKAEIEIQKSLIRKTEILAPFDGVIGLKNVSIGDQINPSTLVGVIRTENKLKIDFNVPEKQVCQKESLFLKLPLLVFVQF